ncbi:hypothetical protein M5362_15645 [Streptomyces sp. Je 1-79]|uniref:hypothetical protein n=1 Tax=Streptomyces sp. Je 1-79 TaxID=2943847 RepID=UPI0021A67E6D|nr:hypothetical protein [Streptomyces sp. Je 1-79]MCT4354567.1 hypothetical protein [Streptomyces sp. Je 1-79]
MEFRVKAVVRGTVCVAALVAALTGCGGDGGTSALGADGKVAPVALTAEQIRAALPTETSLGDIFSGDEAVVAQGQEAREFCAEESGTACEGLVAAGHQELAVRGSSDDGKLEFTLVSFDSPAAAAVVMKGLADEERSDGDAPEPVRVEAGADETDAFASSSRVTHVYLRVGGVVAYVRAIETELGNVNRAAVHQVERIKNGA